jgi:hypothetical protein
VDSIGVHRSVEHGKQGIRDRAVETSSGTNLFNSPQATILSSATTPSTATACKAAIQGIPVVCAPDAAMADEPRSAAASPHRKMI